MENKCNHIRFYGGYDGQNFLGLATYEKAVSFFKNKLEYRYKDYLREIKYIEDFCIPLSKASHNLNIMFPFEEDLRKIFCNYSVYIELDYCPLCGEKLEKGFFEKMIVGEITDYRNTFRKIIPSYKQIKKERDKTLLGYIYVVKVDNHYKIGISKNPKKRFGEYTRLYKEPNVIICEKIKGYDLFEEQLHKRFEDKNERGEWFSLNENDIKEIKEEIDYIKKNGFLK